MKKMKCAILAFAAIVGLCTTPIQAKADEYVNIKSYTEVFTPVNDKDAQLDVTVTGTAGDDGYLYVIATLQQMPPAFQSSGLRALVWAYFWGYKRRSYACVLSMEGAKRRLKTVHPMKKRVQS